MKTTMRILAGSILIALAPMAAAQTTGGGDIDSQVRVLDATAANKGQTQVADKIASNFTNLAGGKDNATALVNALRTGGDATLKTTTTTPGTGGAPPTTTTTSTTVVTPTGQMGWGNVKIALGLAQDVLLKAGITNPTPAQLQTALNGGTLTRADGTTLEVKGVLQMRADGMGWGQIAHAGGTKVGPVVSSLKATNAALEKLPAAGTTTTAVAPTTAKTGVAATDKSAKGVTTAAGAPGATVSGDKAKGVTTAAGGAAAAGGGNSSKGITTASGVSSAGNGNKGLVTANGAGAGHGNAYGKGMVTASGGSASGSVASASGVKGGGVVTASGGTASSSGVTHGGGNAGGNGGGNGNGKGKGG
jgi:hypothetical protein